MSWIFITNPVESSADKKEREQMDYVNEQKGPSCWLCDALACWENFNHGLNNNSRKRNEETKKQKQDKINFFHDSEHKPWPYAME